MAALTGSTIASSYLTLLKLTSAALGADASAKYIEDAAGTDSALSISTTRVGIGTSSPSAELNVEGTGMPSIHISRDYSAGSFDANGWGLGVLAFGGQDSDSGEDNDSAYIRASVPTTAEGGGAWSGSSHPTQLGFWTTPTSATSASERMRITSDGNVGIGVTPEAWQSGFKALRLFTLGSLNVDGSGAGSGFYMSNNAYRDEGDDRWEYIIADEATQYVQYNGVHEWRVASAGSSANDPITFSTAMNIDNNGNVGIGTTAPRSAQGYSGSILEIGSADDVALVLTSDDGEGGENMWEIGNNTSGRLEFVHSVAGDGSTGTKMVIDSSGNVGIGTTSPSAELQVVGNTDFRQIWLTDTDTDDTDQRVGIIAQQYDKDETGAAMIMAHLDSDENRVLIGGGGGSFHAATDIRFWTAANNTTDNGTEKMRILGSGNVGIGTDAPGNLLEIASSTGAAFIEANSAANSDAGLEISEAGTRKWSIYNDGDDSDKLKFYDDGDVRLTIQQDGNVGIGTTSPDTKLTVSEARQGNAQDTMLNQAIIHIDDTTAWASLHADKPTGGGINFGGLYGDTEGQVIFGGIRGLKENNTDNNYDGALLFGTITNGGNLTEKMRITSAGNVGIGTAAPSSSDWNANSKLLHMYQNDTNGASIKLESSNTKSIFATGNNQLQLGNISSDPVRFYTNSAEVMTLLVGGNVGIGDTDPSEAKLSITGVASGDYGIKIDQDQDVGALYIDSESTSASVIDIDSASESGQLLDLDADSLTNGMLAAFNSAATNSTSRVLVNIGNNNAGATGATCLQLDQDANAYGLVIDTEATSVPAIYLNVPQHTTGNVIQVANANSLTTGAVMLLEANGSSNADDNSVMVIQQNHASADKTVGMTILQNGDDAHIEFTGSGGGGIKFTADIASSDANTLDDYEEGVHAVTLGGASFTMSSVKNSLQYTKIGRLVTLSGEISVTAVSSATGTFTISLPFTVADIDDLAERFQGTFSCQNINFSGDYLNIGSYAGQNTMSVQITNDNGAWTYLQGSTFSSTSEFVVSVQYIT